MQIVFDASTLILLAKVDLIREVAGLATAIIPAGVKKEALAKQAPDAELVRILIREKLIEVRQAPKKASDRLGRDFRIHSGEAEALALAIALALPLAVDDGPTIKACKVLGVPFLTAIHFLAHLAGEGVLGRALALEKLSSLSRYGRYRARIIENATRLIEGGN